MATSTSFGPVDGRNVFAGNQFPGATINIGDSKDPSRSPRVCRAIHFPRNDDFVQRSAISEQLARLLPPQVDYQSAALWGLGGSGKTQLALEYAYSRCSDSTCSVFWVHADTETSFAQDYKDIALKLGLADTLDGEKLLKAVRNHIEALPQWVLVLDNADDLTLFGVGHARNATVNRAFNLSAYVPRGTVGTVLWTSRDQQILGSIVGPRRGINVMRMTNAEAEALFQAIAVLEKSEEDFNNVKQLLEELNWLPLAITQAAAYIRRTKLSSAEYLKAIQARKKRWKAFRKSEHDRFRRPEVSNSVLQTWNISMNHVQQENKLAYDILTVLAYTDNQNIPFEMITKIALANAGRAGANSDQDEGHLNTDISTTDPKSSASDSEDDDFCDEVMEAVTRLEEFSFLDSRALQKSSPNYSDRCYDMHKLVQEAVLYNLHLQESDGVEKRLSRIALQVTDDLFPGRRDRKTWSQCERYLGHAQRSLEWLQVHGDAEGAINLLEKASNFLHDVGRWRGKELIDLAIIEALKRTVGIEHPRTLAGMSTLATTYREQGRFDEAERIDKDVLALRNKILGVNHPDTIWSMANLAVTYYQQGRYDEVERIEKDVLALRHEILGANHPDTIWSMANLAATYCRQGRYEEAERIEKDVLALQHEMLGANHPDTIQSMANLAVTYYQQGRYEEAERIEKDALALRREILGVKHLDTIRSMANLAATYYEQGRYDEAERIEKDVLALRHEILGANHSDTIWSMASLGATYRRQGRYNEAERIEQDALALRREVLGVKHPDTISSMAGLATTYHKQERHEEAERIEKDVLALRHEILGANHPDSISSMANLGATYCRQGRYNEAERIEKDALALRLDVLGVKHPDTISSMAGLATTYHKQGRHEEAERIEKEVSALRREILGVKHPDTISSMAALATTYRRQGRYNKGEILFKEVLELRREMLGDRHPDTIQSVLDVEAIQRDLKVILDITADNLPIAGLALA